MMQQDTHSQSQTALPANRAFVVQFRADSNLPQGEIAGRVEHVMSGQAKRFASMEELTTFLTHVLSSSRH